MVNTCTRVSLRQRAIKNDRISLYLDFYPPVRNPETMQMSRREYLGIYIYAHPKNEMAEKKTEIGRTLIVQDEPQLFGAIRVANKTTRRMPLYSEPGLYKL